MNNKYRIGNIVSFPIERSGENFYYETCAITSISQNFASGVILGGDNVIHYDALLAKILPIKITKELLNSLFGFVKIDETEFKEVLAFSVCDKHIIEYFFPKVENYHKSGLFINGFSYNCEHIHKLQNLFFEILDVELQVNIG